MKSPSTICVESTFPDTEPDLSANWGTDWSLDWISSNIQFSGSDILDINAVGQTGICEGIPLQEKIDFFEGLEKVGMEDTAPSPIHLTTLQPPGTIQASSPFYGTGLEITSSVAKELDIADNLFALSIPAPLVSLLIGENPKEEFGPIENLHGHKVIWDNATWQLFSSNTTS